MAKSQCLIIYSGVKVGRLEKGEGKVRNANKTHNVRHNRLGVPQNTSNPLLRLNGQTYER